MKALKPRYTIGTIVTTDVTIVEKSHWVRSLGHTHEDIYRAGLIALDSASSVEKCEDKK
jgi:hypothetical protein